MLMVCGWARFVTSSGSGFEHVHGLNLVNGKDLVDISEVGWDGEDKAQLLQSWGLI